MAALFTVLAVASSLTGKQRSTHLSPHMREYCQVLRVFPAQ